jgi:hypothetical protein
MLIVKKLHKPAYESLDTEVQDEAMPWILSDGIYCKIEDLKYSKQTDFQHLK